VEKCVYGDNGCGCPRSKTWRQILQACWNALSPGPMCQKLNYVDIANPIDAYSWIAVAVGRVVTLTQTQVGDLGEPGLISDQLLFKTSMGFWDFSANPLDGDIVTMEYPPYGNRTLHS